MTTNVFMNIYNKCEKVTLLGCNLDDPKTYEDVFKFKNGVYGYEQDEVKCLFVKIRTDLFLYKLVNDEVIIDERTPKALEFCLSISLKVEEIISIVNNINKIIDILDGRKSIFYIYNQYSRLITISKNMTTDDMLDIRNYVASKKARKLSNIANIPPFTDEEYAELEKACNILHELHILIFLVAYSSDDTIRITNVHEKDLTQVVDTITSYKLKLLNNVI